MAIKKFQKSSFEMSSPWDGFIWYAESHNMLARAPVQDGQEVAMAASLCPIFVAPQP